LSNAVLNAEIQTALTQLNELAQNGKDLGRLLSDLLNHFRNLLIYQVSRGDLNLLEVSEAEVAALKEQSALANTDAFMRILEVFADAELRLRDAASKKIMVEVALLRAIEARNALPLDAVLKQLNQLRGGGQAPVTPAVPVSAPAARPAVAKNPPVRQDAAAAPVALVETPAVPADLAELWKRLGEAVTHASRFVGSYLINAQPVSFNTNLLIIGFDPEFEDQLGLVDNARNHALLQTKLAELGHPNCQIKFIKSEAPVGQKAKPVSLATASETVATPSLTNALKPGGSVPPFAKEKASVAFNKNDFKNDPLIQKALEIFKGQIVEVRA